MFVATDLEYLEEVLLSTNIKTVFDFNKREKDLKVDVRSKQDVRSKRIVKVDVLQMARL